MRHLLAIFALLGMTGQAWAADAMAGKEKAEACFACHGENGISVSAEIPNLAGQKAQYIALQLKAFRAATRKNDLMNAMAADLSDGDIDDLAAYFAGLAGASGGDQVSALPDDVNMTRVEFPKGYPENFTHYTTISFADRKQVRRYLANDVALGAAKDGKPLPNGSYLFVEVYKAKLDGDGKPVMGSDGFYEQDGLAAFTAMEMQAGWGAEIPDRLRNGDWNYAVFKADRTRRDDVNQAQCLACHKPLTEDSYVFSLQALKKQAQAKQ